jgi:hypothetical protein
MLRLTERLRIRPRVLHRCVETRRSALLAEGTRMLEQERVAVLPVKPPYGVRDGACPISTG